MFSTHAGFVHGQRRTGANTASVARSLPVLTTPPTPLPRMVARSAGAVPRRRQRSLSECDTVSTPMTSSYVEPVEEMPQIQRGAARSVIVLNPDPYAIRPYTVVQAQQMNSGDSVYSVATGDYISDDAVSLAPSLPLRGTYDYQRRQEHRASSVYSRPLSELLTLDSGSVAQPADNRTILERTSYYPIDADTAANAALAERLLQQSNESSTPRYVPWIPRHLRIGLALDGTEVDDEDDFFTTRDDAVSDPHSILANDDSPPTLPYNNIIAAASPLSLPTAAVQLNQRYPLKTPLSTRKSRSTVRVQQPMTLQPRKSQTTLERRFKRRVEAADETVLSSIEQAYGSNSHSQNAAIEGIPEEEVLNTYDEIIGRQKGTVPQVGFYIDPYLGLTSDYEMPDHDCRKFVEEINGFRRAHRPVSSSPLILLPTLCSLAQKYVQGLDVTATEPHRIENEDAKQANIALAVTCVNLVNAWLNGLRAARPYISPQPDLMRTLNDGPPGEAATKTRNPFKRALRRMKTMTNLRETWISPCKGRHKKHTDSSWESASSPIPSSQYQVLMSTASTASNSLIPRANSPPLISSDLRPVPISEYDQDMARTARIAIALRTPSPSLPPTPFSQISQGPIRPPSPATPRATLKKVRGTMRPVHVPPPADFPISKLTPTSRDIHLTYTAREAHLLVTENGIFGALTAANWVQGRKYRSQPREKRDFERVVDRKMKWIGVARGASGRWVVLVVGV